MKINFCILVRMENESNRDNDIKLIVLETGIEIFSMEKVRLIRIKSEDYTLLIMRDHCPIVGEVNGDVIVEGDFQKEFEGIRGFYIFRKNEFCLMISGKMANDNK